MITFEQEKQAKEALVEFLHYALLFLSETTGILVENTDDTPLDNAQRLSLGSLFSAFRNNFDVELAENQIWEIHPSDLEAAGLYGSRLHIKIRAIQHWDQQYTSTTLERNLFLPCLVTAIDSLLNKLIRDCCIDEAPLEVSRILHSAINTTGLSFCRPFPFLPTETTPVQECLQAGALDNNL